MKDQATRALARAAWDHFTRPDYGEGRFYVHAGGYKKLCSNQATAVAWARYLRRRDKYLDLSIERKT